MRNSDFSFDCCLVGETEKERFRAACAEVFRDWDHERLLSGIGTFNEKRLHAVIKRFLSPDTTRHEVRLANGRRINDDTGGAEKNSCLGYVADVLSEDGDIYEVQTGSLFPLRGKLEWYLNNTGYNINVVYPVPYIKWLRWIEPENGSVGAKHRSPKRGGLNEIAHELYWIREFIGDKRFGFQVLFIDMEEYRVRNGWDKTGKRGSERHERVPIGLEGIINLNVADDYKIFLPDSLPREFIASKYAEITGIRGKSIYSTLKILCGLGLLEQTGEKKKKSSLYRIV